MRCLYSLALAAFLSASSGAMVVTPMPQVSDPSDEICDQALGATKPPAASAQSEKTAILATVTGIDLLHGVVILETKVGRAQIEAPPQTLKELQIGDQVELCTVDEEPSENLLQDSILT